MPYEYSLPQFSAKIQRWLQNPNPSVIEQTDESYFEFRGKNTKFLFDFSVCFEGPYRMVFGYCLENNGVTLNIPRAWYFSRSESAWRVFTGIDLTKARFLKGLDVFERSTAAGYAYEAIVDDHIGDALDYFWHVNRPNNSFELDKIALTHAYSEDIHIGYLCIALKHDPSFTCRIHQNGEPPRQPAPLAINNYRTETKYDDMVPASLITKSRVTEGKKTFSCLTRIRDASSVDVQQSHRATLTPDQITRFASEASIYQNLERLQKDKLFWQIMKECLKKPTKIKHGFHALLKKQITIYRYTLDVCKVITVKQSVFKTVPDIRHKPIENLVIDISVTDEEIHYEYQRYAAQMTPEDRIIIDTPMCWISNIFLENSEITSFGHHSRIPINLSFLVQKPIDYIESVRKEDCERLGITQSNRDSNEPNPYIIDNTYIDLNLVNEATNPLIRAFKHLHGIPMFLLKHTTEDDVILQADPRATIAISSFSITDRSSIQHVPCHHTSSSSSSSSSSSTTAEIPISSIAQSHFFVPQIQVPVVLPDRSEKFDKPRKPS